jgi:hypothetical protein
MAFQRGVPFDVIRELRETFGAETAQSFTSTIIDKFDALTAAADEVIRSVRESTPLVRTNVAALLDQFPAARFPSTASYLTELQRKIDRIETALVTLAELWA